MEYEGLFYSVHLQNHVKKGKVYWYKFVQSFVSTSIWHVSHKMHVEMHVCLCMKSVILAWPEPNVEYIAKLTAQYQMTEKSVKRVCICY